MDLAVFFVSHRDYAAKAVLEQKDTDPSHISLDYLQSESKNGFSEQR